MADYKCAGRGVLVTDARSPPVLTFYPFGEKGAGFCPRCADGAEEACFNGAEPGRRGRHGDVPARFLYGADFGMHIGPGQHAQKRILSEIRHIMRAMQPASQQARQAAVMIPIACSK